MLGLGIRDVTADYELGDLVGEGAFGVVRRCKHRQTGQEYACKTVVKDQLKRRADVEDVRREVQILMVRSIHFINKNKNIVSVLLSFLKALPAPALCFPPNYGSTIILLTLFYPNNLFTDAKFTS